MDIKGRIINFILFSIIFAISVILSGCLNLSPKVVEVNFDLLSVSKNDTSYDAVVIVKSMSGNRKIPLDAFFVGTGKRIFFLSDSLNVTIIRKGNNTDLVEPCDIYKIHLKASDKYLNICPQTHDLRILSYLFVKPNAEIFGDTTGYIVNPEKDKRKGIIVPPHRACYFNNTIFILDDCLIGSKGTILKPLDIENVNLKSLNTRGFTLKRIIYEIVGADTLGIVMAIDKNGYGFSIENDEQGAFLFAPIKNEKEALSYLQFLMHDIQYSVRRRQYKEITSDKMFTYTINMIKKHCKERGKDIKIIRIPPTKVTKVKAEGKKYIVERVYFTQFPEKIEYVKAFVYKNGKVKIIKKYDCIIGISYVML